MPYLHHLEIRHAIHDTRGVRIDCLIPTLSPALKILKIIVVHLPEDALVLPILDLAKARGCDLEVFAYEFSAIHHTPEVLASFRTLGEVKLNMSWTSQQESSITIVTFLTSLPSLRSLACNLTVFMRMSYTSDDTLHHTSLQKMNILSPPVLFWDLFRSCVFPSVTEAKIHYESGPAGIFRHLESDLTRRLTFEGLDTSCPNILKLDLKIFSGYVYDTFDFKHITPLLRLPVHVFHLQAAKLQFTPSDYQTM